MKKFLLIIFILITCLILYGFFINPKEFTIKSDVIKIEGLVSSFEGFKILQISDTLLKSETDLNRLENNLKKINNLKPDIIVFTGDLLYKENTLNEEDITKLTEILKNMECTLYKYAVYGDNDDKTKYSEIMDKAGFKVLDNESSYIFYKDVLPIKITGLTNLENVSNSLSMEDNLDTTLNLVITHYPDYFETIKNEDVDVVLAGHSLNGQVIIPFYGGIIKSEGARKYVNGTFNENNTRLYITGGIGTKKVNFRLFNKPEVNLYTLATT